MSLGVKLDRITDLLTQVLARMPDQHVVPVLPESVRNPGPVSEVAHNMLIDPNKPASGVGKIANPGDKDSLLAELSTTFQEYHGHVSGPRKRGRPPKVKHGN